MVTPSLVMVGAPHCLSMTTLRPFGPSVTLTALASLSTPRSSDLRAASLNSSVLAMCFLNYSQFLGLMTEPRREPVAGTSPGRVIQRLKSADDDREDVTSGQDEVLIAVVLDLGAAVLAVDDLVADGNVERNAVAVVVDAAGPDRQDLALLGLLLGGVRDHEARCSGLLGLAGLDDDAVFEGLDGNRHV